MNKARLTILMLEDEPWPQTITLFSCKGEWTQKVEFENLSV